VSAPRDPERDRQLEQAVADVTENLIAAVSADDAERVTPEGHVDDVGCSCGPVVHPVAGLMHTLTAEPLTAEQEEECHRRSVELWTRLGRAPGMYPTPDQLLAYFRECDDALGIKLAGRLVEAAQIAEAVGRRA
jgi:hypothetical protein